ncbi:MAG TPA: hypothetical protein VFU10_01675 [Gaiellaceae bacterium]|nr:hypothetical protein [Gaiellaceae bacterium]
MIHALPAPAPNPSVVARSFAAFLSDPQGGGSLYWRTPEWVTFRPAPKGLATPFVQRRGAQYYGPPTRSVVRNAFAARPDAYSELWARTQDPAMILLGRARGRTAKLKSTRINGRAALRGSFALAPNRCAGLKRGTETVWLDRSTLLPLRITEKRSASATTTIEYRAINTPIPPPIFLPPAATTRPTRLNQGFIRTTPAIADKRVPFAASLPTRLPAGFTLSVSGWAPRSARTGAEASNPRYRSLFAAVYRRGWEHIDVTQRLAGAKGWLGDPFGFECGAETSSTIDVEGAKATFGQGGEIVPHLYWRSGRVLYTVSGPFPAPTLAAVARSLKPVGG